MVNMGLANMFFDSEHLHGVTKLMNININLLVALQHEAINGPMRCHRIFTPCKCKNEMIIKSGLNEIYLSAAEINSIG